MSERWDACNLASGRPIYAIEKYAKELELENVIGYIVGFNGAAVKDCKAKRMIMQRNIPMEYIKMLYDLSVENGVYISPMLGMRLLLQKNNQYTEVEGKLTGMPIGETEDFVKTVNQEASQVAHAQKNRNILGLFMRNSAMN